MFKVLAKDGNAKRGEFTTVHGKIQTPVFMNVGTAAAIKGAVATEDLKTIKTQVELSNTYHLHVRPGDKVVKKKELSFHVNPNSHLEYLNFDNNTWKHPCTGEEFSYSFFDLYDMALVKTVKIINEVDKMLNDKKIDNKRIEKLFGNLDYGTGMDCDLEMKYKYFKY